MGRQGAEDFELRHEAGIHPEQIQFLNPGPGADLIQGFIQLVQVDLVAKAGCQRDPRIPPPVEVASDQPPGQPIPWSDRIRA